MKKRIIVIKQEGVKDCGVASLLSIIKYYGGNIGIERLREETKTTKNGTTAFHLIDYANKIGFSSKGIKCADINDLKSITLPAIAHLVINKSYKHYVVIYKVDFKHNVITIMDPAYGVKKLTFKEFNNIWSKVIITFYPIGKISKYEQNNKIYSLIKNILLSNKRLIFCTIILSIFVIGSNIVNSYYFKIIIDNFFGNSFYSFCFISFIFALIIFLKLISDYFRNKLLFSLQQKIDFNLITTSFKHIINLPYNYFKNHTSGELISRINDLNYIKEILSKIILNVFLDSIMIIFIAIILFNINLKLFIITIFMCMLYLLIVIIFSKLFKKQILISQIKFSKTNSYMFECTNGFETIKNMNLENKITNNFENKYVDYLGHEYKVRNYNNIQQFFKSLINDIGSLIILFTGYVLVLQNKLSLGELITFNVLLSYFVNPIRNILDLEPLVRYALSSLKRINEIFEIKQENLCIDNKYSGCNIKGELEFKGLTFSFNDKDNILNNINLKIRKGERIAIIGKSGCGKSTMLKLILRYNDIKRNMIFIDGKDINDYNLKELRNNITYVSQNEVLFNDTIMNNILIKNNLDYDTFLNKCKLTLVNNICNNKYLGYDTLLEENGFNLSGGERERIILCRALTKNSNLIILDEALNQIDVDMERKILKNLFSLTLHKTIIVVSHRLENLDLFDRIITMENGNIKKTNKRRVYING